MFRKLNHILHKDILGSFFSIRKLLMSVTSNERITSASEFFRSRTQVALTRAAEILKTVSLLPGLNNTEFCAHQNKRGGDTRREPALLMR